MNLTERAHTFLLPSRLLLIGCLVAVPALAQQTPPDVDEDWFSGSVFLGPTWVDNATGTPDEDAQVNELQTELGLVLNADWRSTYSAASFDYQVSSFRYDEDSQPDDEVWTGNSGFTLGNSATTAELNVEHSIRRLLRDPGSSPVVLGNSEERQIYAIRPLLRTRLGSANQAAAVVYFSEVDFADSRSNDSRRTGLDLLLTRFVSPLREVSLIVGQRSIDYDTSDIADYDLNSVSARMLSEHRRYDYRVEIGVSRLRPEIGENTDRTTFDFLLNSRLVGNQFTFFFNRSISDSSLGNDNSEFFSNEVSFDGALADRDQVERTSFGLGWAYALICQRCDLSLTTGLEDVDYLSLSINDSEQLFMDLGFAYRFSPQLTSSLSTRVIETTFDDRDSLRDTETQITRVELAYEFNPSFDISLTHELDRRDSDALATYRVNSTSLRLSFNF